jgi:hypothetical protein
MKTYIEKLRIKKIVSGYYEVVGHHCDYQVTIERSYENPSEWTSLGLYFSTLKDAKAHIYQELATEHAEHYTEVEVV